MFYIDTVHESILKIVEAHGVKSDSLRLGAFCDRDRDYRPTPIYLFATQSELILLEGKWESDTLPTAQNAGDCFVEASYQSYSLSDLHGFRCEELLSSGRLTALRGEEKTPILIAGFTNFCRTSMQVFVKYLERIAKGEDPEIDPKDDPAEQHCPTCGLRYPDRNRRVCPHCMEKGKLFKRFSVFILRYRLYVIITVLSLVLLTAMSILAPYLSSGFFYDEVIFGTGEFAGAILTVLFLIISTRLLKLLATVINNRVTSEIAAKMVFDLKKTIFGAIERLSLSFFTGRQTGGLMTQVNQDANTIYTFFCDSVPYLIVNAVQVVVLVVLLFVLHPILAACALATIPVFVVLLRWFYRKKRKLHAKYYAGSRRLNGFLADVLSGARVVKAFSKEQEEVARFGVHNGRLATDERKLAVFNHYAGPAAGMILYLGNIIAWGLGGWFVISGNGGMTYGMLLTFIAYLNMVFEPLNFFIDFVDRTADCSNALQRLFEIMDAEPDVVQKEDALAPVDLGGAVEFEKVSFSYQKGKKIIDDVSFSVPEGSLLGIVGHTGAGKSTLANLLMRMYDVEDGEIRIGGYPVKDLELATLYRNIAIVSQETYLFMGTILDNIRYARPDADFEEVVEAAKCAGAHDFIMRLPDAYQTRIGFGYQDLSGGERQRISIARAILKNPKILILDEATAAMDTGTERKIQEALTQLIKGKTTIMIAHRLSTLRDADKLIVIEHGRVAECGTQKELLEKEDGVYKKLYTLQEEALKNAGICE